MLSLDRFAEGFQNLIFNQDHNQLVRKESQSGHHISYLMENRVCKSICIFTFGFGSLMFMSLEVQYDIQNRLGYSHFRVKIHVFLNSYIKKILASEEFWWDGFQVYFCSFVLLLGTHSEGHKLIFVQNQTLVCIINYSRTAGFRLPLSYYN